MIPDGWRVIDLIHIIKNPSVEDLFPAIRFPATATVFEDGDPLDCYPNYDPTAKPRIFIDPYEDELQTLDCEEAQFYQGFGAIPLHDGQLAIGRQGHEREASCDSHGPPELSRPFGAEEAVKRHEYDMSKNAGCPSVGTDNMVVTYCSPVFSVRPLRPHASDPLEPTQYPPERKLRTDC
jgi:hypothetical protein